MHIVSINVELKVLKYDSRQWFYGFLMLEQ